MICTMDDMHYELATVDDPNNMMYQAVSISGLEMGMGFYGDYDAASRTLDMKGSGPSGVFDGVTVDTLRPVIYKTKLTVNAEKGSANMMIDGKDAITGVCAGISDSRALLFEMDPV